MYETMYKCNKQSGKQTKTSEERKHKALETNNYVQIFR